MNPLLSALPQRLGELALQATLWLSLGLALALVVGTSPRLRKHLLACTLAGLLVLTLFMLLPAPLWQLADYWPSHGGKCSAVNATASDLTTTITHGTPGATLGFRLTWFSYFFAPSASELPVTAPERREHFGWPLLITALALVASAFCLLRFMASLWGIRRLRQESQSLACRPTLTLVENLARHLGLSRLPELRVHPRLAVPGTFGWRRPVILLPADWANWSREELRCVLAHELAHVRAGDFRLSLLVQVVRAVHGYHPLAHFASRQLLNQLELLADQLAASAVGGTAAYARTLCRLALRPRRPVPLPPALAFWPAAIPLSGRMTMLTTNPKATRPLSWGRRFSLACVLLLGLALIAGLRSPSAATAEPPASPELETRKTQANVTVEITPYETRYCRANAHGIWALRPAQLLALPSMQSQKARLDEPVQAMFQALLGKHVVPWTLADVEQIVGSCFLTAKTQNEMGQLNASLEFIRLVPGKKWSDFFKQALPDVKPAMHSGKPYFALPMPLHAMIAGGQGNLYAGLVDERSLVLGSETQVKEALEDKAARTASPWSDADWQRVGDGPFIVAADLQAICRVIDSSGDDVQEGLLTRFKPVWRKARYFVAGMLNTDDLRLVALVGAAPGQQLEVDGEFVGAMRAGLDAVISEVTVLTTDQVAAERLFINTGAVDGAAVLRCQHLILGLGVKTTIGELLRPRQPAPEAVPHGTAPTTKRYELNISILELPREVLESETLKPFLDELQEPVRAEAGKLYTPSGWRLLPTKDVAKLQAALLADKRCSLLSTPRLVCLEGAPAAIQVGPSPAENKVALTVTPSQGAAPGAVQLDISNCIDVGAQAGPPARPKGQPEVRRQATVPAGQSLLLVVPGVTPDGKLQLILTTPKVLAAKAEDDVVFQLILGTVDEAGAKQLAPLFTPMESPAGQHPIAALYEKDQEQFGREMTRLHQAGHIKFLARPSLQAAMGQSEDFRFVWSPQRIYRIGVIPRQWRGSDGVEFELISGFEMATEQGEKQSNRLTIVGRLGTNYVQLERRLDGKGWWLVGVRPVRPNAKAPNNTPSKIASPVDQ